MIKHKVCMHHSSSHTIRNSLLYLITAFTLCLPSAQGQMTQGGDINVSLMTNYQNECAIISNPTNAQQLFAACNNATGGLFAARSTNRGVTWVYSDAADGTIADGDMNQGPAACCDPTLAWDSFGNLFVGYLDAAVNNVIILNSVDGGVTFNTLATFPGSVDQPTIRAENTTAAGAPVALWAVWNQSGTMRARGAAVTGLGAIGGFNALQNIPGTNGCSFGDVAISPAGVVVQVCQYPTGGEGPGSIRLNSDADGLGPNNFGASSVATTTNVGGFDFIPAQNTRSIDAEAGLAYDRNPLSPRFGRLYLVYTEEPINEDNNTDIMVRFSDDDGANWSVPIQVNDDPAAPIRSQFLPRIDTNQISGNIGVCWHDARNSAGNNTMQEFCTIATPAPANPAFMANIQVGDVASTGVGSSPPVAGQLDIQYGDYSGMSYFQGIIHPIWADDTNSTADNPDGAGTFDAYTDRVTGGAAANEGDPHMTTRDGTRYDFQSAGEFVSLLGDGLEVQIRQTPVSTTFFPGVNGHTGLATCVSLNTAAAARVGSHRVSYQPSLSGVPDPGGMELRVDGSLMTPGPGGIDLSDGGRIINAPVGNGLQIEFPSGARLVLTPGWWSSQSKWYLNINVYSTMATEGTMGVLAPGSWLPSLPDGSSMGARPADLADRYQDLNVTFANAWRVTNVNSLFDYAPGASTSDFTLASWPKQSAPCVVPQMPEVGPAGLMVAQNACAPIADPERRVNCVFDVGITGETGFAATYLLTDQLERSGTTITVTDNADPSVFRDFVTFRAAVNSLAGRAGVTPRGKVQFVVDSANAGGAVDVDAGGQAEWRTANLTLGDHRIMARYTPAASGDFLPSVSATESHTVVMPKIELPQVVPPSSSDERLLWLLLLIAVVVALIVWFIRRP